MKCRMVDAEPRDERGWRRVRCTRPGCGRVSKSKTPHEPHEINFPCRAWPEWWEFGEWVAIALGALFVTPQSILRIRRLLGLDEIACNCEARKEWLNTFGGRLSQRTDWLGKWLCRRLVQKATPSAPSDTSASQQPAAVVARQTD
jgi:hypothetical protein